MRHHRPDEVDGAELTEDGITVGAIVLDAIDAHAGHEARNAQAIDVSGERRSDDAADDEATVRALAAERCASAPAEPDAIARRSYLSRDAIAMISGTRLALTGDNSADVTA